MTHQDYVDGYLDGRHLDSPAPSENRSERYKHSFLVGRAEVAGCSIPFRVSMARVVEVEKYEAKR